MGRQISVASYSTVSPEPSPLEVIVYVLDNQSDVNWMKGRARIRDSFSHSLGLSPRFVVVVVFFFLILHETFIYLFLFFSFLAALWHVEVPRPGVRSEL